MIFLPGFFYLSNPIFLLHNFLEHKKKAPTPQSILQNQYFVVRHQGFEPWTP